jgi:isovaleryl-CoA dehydrogenase
MVRKGSSVRVRLRASMDLSLSDEQRDFVAAIRDFCERECGTLEQRAWLTSGYSEAHNAELYRRMAELGWLGVAIPEQYGGSGGTMLDACLFMEETSRGLAPIGGYATTLIVAGATNRFGTEEQKAKILGGIASGSVEAIAMTEPEAGSDVGSLTTEARRVNGGFVLNGQKVFCSNAHISDHVLVVARTTRGEDKHHGLSMIFVPKGAKGMQVEPIETMGGRETNHLYFSDCEASEEAVLGEVDQGWMQLMAGLNVERLILAATMLGIAHRAFDDALAYVKERRQFGRPIGSFQALQHRLADLATDLEAARLMTWWVASLTDEDPDRMLPREASMVKLLVTETAKRAALEGMQMMGAYGYSSEYDMERLVRQALVSTIYGGTSEIQRNIIAKTLGL